MTKSHYTLLLTFVFAGQFFLLIPGLVGQEVRYFYHKPTDTFLEVQEADRGILVKKHQNKQWIVFSRRKPGLFFDKSGNRIEMWNENKLSYVPARSKTGRIYTRWQENEFIPGQINNPTPDKIEVRPEGLWYCKTQDIYLIVVETREGLKARLKDERKWENYKMQGNSNIFVSEKGNQYSLNQASMVYFHNDGKHKLDFEKISDTFDGY